MALYHYGSSASKGAPRTGPSEFEILKAAHRFLRDEDESSKEKGKEMTWDEQLASKYYASLYREFAVCDLKHYKSGNFALRWRTESEVLSGAGETTCGNTRCEHHHPLPDHLQRSSSVPSGPPLTTLELPFAYVEHGENKAALVKVVLCPRCFDKLMWKRRKEKEADGEREGQENRIEKRKGKDGRRERDRRRGESDLVGGGTGSVKVGYDARVSEDLQEKAWKSNREETVRVKEEEEEEEVGVRLAGNVTRHAYEHEEDIQRRRSKHRSGREEGEEFEVGRRRRRTSRSISPRRSIQHEEERERRDYRRRKG
ncbi:hypothetical protein DXG03_000433 [Asterophora parasitica]|uniref:Protein FRA10AC1 n=1 Tax=Asterophora parasitica TaxID=117018 RepID=A0A9P7GHE3_9AGAR|nr:hypothetical protein DXG03_000433 [Asterophora parasitica]